MLQARACLTTPQQLCSDGSHATAWWTFHNPMQLGRPTGNMAFVPVGMAHDAFDLLAGTKPEAELTEFKSK
jgi:hypothetical protein